jgi:hypothetical protein
MEALSKEDARRERERDALRSGHIPGLRPAGDQQSLDARPTRIRQRNDQKEARSRPQAQGGLPHKAPGIQSLWPRRRSQENFARPTAFCSVRSEPRTRCRSQWRTGDLRWTNSGRGLLPCSTSSRTSSARLRRSSSEASREQKMGARVGPRRVGDRPPLVGPHQGSLRPHDRRRRPSSPSRPPWR